MKRHDESTGGARALRGAFFALIVLGTPAALAGQDLDQGATTGGDGSAPRRATLRAVERAGDIRIDGRLDDEAWRTARAVSGFIQGEPVEGVPAEEDTEVRVLFDGEALYVAARMYDVDPASIARQLVRRDEGRGAFDWFRVALDPNLDRRTGYSFQVSAAGVQADEYIFNDRQMDGAWNAVWESAVTVDEQGWVAEIRIPLSQIRYEASDDPQTWGVNFVRRRTVSNETSYFALRSRLQEGTVSQFGLLEGVRVPGGARRIEARPYVVSSFHNGPAEEGDPFFSGREVAARTGVDLRLGLGSAFTLDATVNPDFGQVESDPAVINLSDNESFFREQRPFFVEDAQIFDFGLSGGRNQLFYSRRIGRSPRGDAPDAATFEDIPEAATILGAAKVTGRTSGGLSMGALLAVTDAEQGRAHVPEAAAGATTERFLVEPRTEHGVFSLQQDFNEGASQVGGIVTALHRDLPGDGSFDFLPNQAYNGGIRFEHQWADRTWSLHGFASASHVRGDSVALIDIQRASNHYFHRPDATRLGVDSTATSLTGAEWRLQLDKQNGRHWTGGVWVAEVTKGFEINDMGFSTVNERLDGGFRVGYREIQPGSVFRDYNINLNTFHNISHEALDDWTSPGSWTDAYLMGNMRLNARGTFLNYWGADVHLNYSFDHYNFGLTRGGPVMWDPGSVMLGMGFNSDRRKALSWRGNLNLRHGMEDSGGNFSVSGTMSIRPSPRLEIEVSPDVNWQTEAAQYVTSSSAVPFDATYGKRYLFGDLERTTVSMETRVNMAFTPTLTFQLFAQPLLSSGDYVSYKQLVAPRTYDFDVLGEGELVTVGGERFCQGGRLCSEVTEDGRKQWVDFDGDGRVDFDFGDRDFNIRSLVGNAVLRWEYRPGSTIFLVWQRRQADRLLTGDFELGRDVNGLFAAPSDDYFMIKVNYWLGL